MIPPIHLRRGDDARFTACGIRADINPASTLPELTDCRRCRSTGLHRDLRTHRPHPADPQPWEE